jgi:hypothetical protein
MKFNLNGGSFFNRRFLYEIHYFQTGRVEPLSKTTF